MSVLVFATCTIFLQRPDTFEMSGFFDHAPSTIAATNKFEEYVAGSTRLYIHPQASPTFVQEPHPGYYHPERHAGIACTLSLWRSVEAVFAYSYSNAHAQALGRRKEWFAQGDWPVYAAWWAGDDYVPSFADAALRLDHLHAQGSTPVAFDFKAPYDADGARATVDRTRVRQLMQSA